MYEKKLLVTSLLLLILFNSSNAQIPTINLPSDTIRIESAFLGNSYSLEGKKMNLHVLKWFMLDSPMAHQKIQSAAFSDQLSVLGYTVGGLLFFSGFFLYEENRPLARELLEFGAYGIGGGLLFQFITGKIEKKAVMIYNQEIKETRRKNAWSVEMDKEGLVLRWKF
jgi:hypothetical protein